MCRLRQAKLVILASALAKENYLQRIMKVYSTKLFDEILSGLTVKEIFGLNKDRQHLKLGVCMCGKIEKEEVTGFSVTAYECTSVFSGKERKNVF